MAKISITNKFSRRNSQIKRDLQELPRKAHGFWRKTTPIRSGNARNKTSLQGNTIFANYPYAGRLDEGYSKQAPRGMYEPTLAYVRRLVRYITR